MTNGILRCITENTQRGENDGTNTFRCIWTWNFNEMELIQTCFPLVPFSKIFWSKWVIPSKFLNFACIDSILGGKCFVLKKPSSKDHWCVTTKYIYCVDNTQDYMLGEGTFWNLNSIYKHVSVDVPSNTKCLLIATSSKFRSKRSDALSDSGKALRTSK